MSTRSLTPKRIHLLGSGRHEEGVAGATITPGMLIDTGAAGTLAPHASAGGVAEKAFAIEDALQGKTINDNYASGSRVSYVLAAPGDVVYGWLASGEKTTTASFLTSNGDGTLKVAGGTDVRVAKALEALDLEDSFAPDTRIRIRVL